MRVIYERQVAQTKVLRVILVGRSVFACWQCCEGRVMKEATHEFGVQRSSEFSKEVPFYTDLIFSLIQNDRTVAHVDTVYVEDFEYPVV